MARTSSRFATEARNAAMAWKQTTTVLPDSARVDGPYALGGPTYPFCLPTEEAVHNLLPASREAVLAHFAAGAIRWHKGIGAGPTTHLLSSQVQCANALGPGLRDPSAVRRVFGGVLDVAEVLPVDDPANPSDHVAFEWIGRQDHLGEWGRGTASRGSNATSADAMIRYRTSTGATELALIEWKYTESYDLKPLSGGERSLATRLGRYGALAEDPTGPVDLQGLAVADLFVEPVYQLLRLQLLAHEIEGTDEADVVRVVYAAPGRNAALWEGVPHGLRHLGKDLREVWRTFLRRPDRFLWLDTADLFNGDTGGGAYAQRYAHQSRNG